MRMVHFLGAGACVSNVQLPPVPSITFAPRHASGQRKPHTEAASCPGRLSRGVTPAVIQSVAFSACSNLLAVSSARGTTHLFRLAPPRANGPANQLQDTAPDAAGGACNMPTMRA